MMNGARAAVDRLLDMYDEYKTLAAKITAAERRLALAKLKNSGVEQTNDSYFWVVAQFSDMDIGTAYRAQTIATLIEGVVGVAAVWGLSLLLL